MMSNDGFCFVTITSYVENHQRPKSIVSSEYYWAWPRVTGLKVNWLLGDPICGADGVPWVRYDNGRGPGTTLTEQEMHIVHKDAVGHIRSLNEAAMLEDPTYQAKTIPALFSNSAGNILARLGGLKIEASSEFDVSDVVLPVDELDLLQLPNA
jgi:hypothetical protein